MRIYSVSQQKASLENYFLAVTGGEGISGQPAAATVTAEYQVT